MDTGKQVEILGGPQTTDFSEQQAWQDVGDNPGRGAESGVQRFDTILLGSFKPPAYRRPDNLADGGYGGALINQIKERI